jgi:hypothetical protein
MSSSLRTRAPFPDCLGPISGAVRDHNDDDGWGWRLMYGLDGEVHDLVERRCAEIDATVACPVGTGRLRDSTEHEVDRGTVGIGNDDPYAGYVEEGTRYLAAEPFVTPQPVPDEAAVTPRRLASACPQGHPLPTQPTRWFDGVTWRDGREACRHCYEAGPARDQTTAVAS